MFFKYDDIEKELLGTQTLQAKPSIHIYPNPAQNVISITNENTGTIQIFDLSDRAVLNKNVQTGKKQHFIKTN